MFIGFSHILVIDDCWLLNKPFKTKDTNIKVYVVKSYYIAN